MGLEARNVPTYCSEVVTIVDVLKINGATSFCSSFLGISTKTNTVTTTKTKTTTITTGTASTTVIFLPGNPPKARRDTAAEAMIDGLIEKRNLPAYATAFASSQLSSACSCLNIPTPQATVTSTTTVTSTKSVSPSMVTKTVYPCSTNSAGALIGLGRAAGTYTYFGGGGLHGHDTPEGLDQIACCNACYFEFPSCFQAYFNSYEGCVIDTIFANDTGPGVSTVCPNGQIPGLMYVPDYGADPRSTGDIAGPCGVEYTNV